MTALIDEVVAEPGELTQSLCSPWQNDYRECGCYYWAASRPDYVNVEPTASGASIGNNWMARSRVPKRYEPDNPNNPRQLNYEDLFRTGRDCCGSSSRAATMTELSSSRPRVRPMPIWSTAGSAGMFVRTAAGCTTSTRRPGTSWTSSSGPATRARWPTC